MSREEKKLFEELTEEVKKIIEEKLFDMKEDAKKLFNLIKERRIAYLENSTLLALGIAFTIGLAIGVAIAKGKKS
ncbi:hypothetical protein KEJ50_05305 [Candidatus Bathyarchaeota archaeon]|nr:hypothetical protein [Candidatus Bathyarchaeota archaeon]